jgi:hypothetical protein
MKKIIVFVVITTLIVVIFFLTDGFTYLGGKLQPIPAFLFFFIMAVVFTVNFLYLISGALKRYANKVKIVPFRE